MLSRGQGAQHVRVGRHRDDPGADLLCGQELLHDPVVQDQDLLAPKVREGRVRRSPFPGEDRVVHDGVGRGEISRPRPQVRIRHPLQEVDLAVLQVLAPLGPRPQAELHVQPHDPGDSPGQFDVVAARIAVLVDELVGGVAPVSADDDESPVVCRTVGRGEEEQEEHDEGHGPEDAAFGAAGCRCRSHLESVCWGPGRHRRGGRLMV